MPQMKLFKMSESERNEKFVLLMNELSAVAKVKADKKAFDTACLEKIKASEETIEYLREELGEP